MSKEPMISIVDGVIENKREKEIARLERVLAQKKKERDITDLERALHKEKIGEIVKQKAAEAAKRHPDDAYRGFRSSGNWQKGEPHKVHRAAKHGWLKGMPDIADFLGVGYMTVRRYIREHGLPAWQEGKGGLWHSHKHFILLWSLGKVDFRKKDTQKIDLLTLSDDEIEELIMDIDND